MPRTTEIRSSGFIKGFDELVVDGVEFRIVDRQLLVGRDWYGAVSEGDVIHWAGGSVLREDKPLVPGEIPSELASWVERFEYRNATLESIRIFFDPSSDAEPSEAVRSGPTWRLRLRENPLEVTGRVVSLGDSPPVTVPPGAAVVVEDGNLYVWNGRLNEQGDEGED